MKDFEEQECIPFEPRKYLMNAIMNNITIFLIGKTFTKEDAVFKEFLILNFLEWNYFLEQESKPSSMSSHGLDSLEMKHLSS